MQRAADISAQAHVKAMQQCSVGMNEYQLEAVIQSHCMAEGARFQAYTPIVAAGKNACILHYIDNNQAINEGDLILIDAGCELDNYASDITRTFPASGTFSDEQRAIYQLVLDANKACIEAVKPGCNWDSLHQLSVTILTEGLVELGLLSGEVEQLVESGAYRRFYMHRVGHWLGMDVHDVGSYRVDGQWRELAPGIVTTIEPGIYIAPDDHSVEERWRGIGVRIEDDVLVTEDGAHVLTAAVPKEIDEIEALMRRA
jgi:Xaa-Pro aminopeptidase